MDYVIKLKDVSVSYLQSRKGVYSIKDFLLKASFINPFRRYEVLHHIDLEIAKGDSICILGPNGCGKSTLLRVIARIAKPDKGFLDVKAPISPLLSLGAGIELELTGYENIRMAIAIAGYYKRNTRHEMIEKVADFAELTKEQLRMPTKMYSTGMLARLAFSSVIVGQPELLMIDEVLAVGDKGFQRKCINRIHEIMENGATLLFVSHNPVEALELCKRGICIKDGSIIYNGNAEKAAEVYLDLFK